MVKASENIHVSQPSISSAISRLEESYSIPLFIRHHAQGVTLTSAGRALLVEAKALLNHAGQLHGFAGELSDKIMGTLEVGCFNPLAPIITPELCGSFARDHSEAELSVREAHQAELLQLLHQGSIDLALTYDLQIPKDIEFIHLAELPPYVLLSTSHRLAKHPCLSLEQLTDEPLILLDLPHSSDYFIGLFTAHQVKPRIKARTRLPEVQRGLVASGQCYSLANVRPLNKKALDGKSLKYVPLEGKHLPLNLGIALLKSNRPTLVQTAFVDHCIKAVSARQIPGMTMVFD